MNNSRSPGNRLLAALPTAEYERLRRHLQPMLFTHGQLLQRAGEPIERVYFVEKGMASLVMVAEDGVQVEVGVVGNEGMVGAAVVLGDNPPLTESMVQIPGKGWWMPARILVAEFSQTEILHQSLLRYMQLLMTLTSQTALCNRLHSVEARLAKWLLMSRDRVQSNELELTQEFLAQMLGSRRSGITIAAGDLRDAGLIDYTRGCITILDEPGLQERACECYSAIQGRFEQLLQDI
ncbi:MAG TPA: Crp/Fnr family transcriptional regulator [Abditibacteriaceae bacterium]|jgi:CRP-like cAMP-binding protein